MAWCRGSRRRPASWRGRPRDELLHRLHQLRGAAALEATRPVAAPPPPDDGLGDIAEFWGATVAVATTAPAAVRPDALLDQLDVPPPVAEALRPAYFALPPDSTPV